MNCPRCCCAGALVGLARVDCVNRRCPCFYGPARVALDDCPSSGEFAGDSVFWIRRMLFVLEKESAHD